MTRFAHARCMSEKHTHGRENVPVRPQTGTQSPNSSQTSIGFCYWSTAFQFWGIPMAASTTSVRASKGARRLVTTCLGLLPGQELLIFADETTFEAVQVIHQTALEHQVYTTILLVPLSDQVRYARSHEFPLLTQAAMRDAMAILTCVSDLPEAMNFRAMIIRTAKDFQTKIGNCPGMNVEMLATAVNVDYSTVTTDCSLLAMALVKSQGLEVITRGAEERAHVLQLRLGHWERVPVTSTGIIEQGVWGNIPSGETYVAPLEDSAEGEIIINGSVPGYVFPRGREIRLSFRGGELLGIEPRDDPGAQFVQAKLDAARASGDVNCHRLAEIGVGVNPGISKLIGIPLLDEKKAGTAHIALGNNKDFGGLLDSSLHMDLVTVAPTIRADGKIILDEGRLAVREQDWRESYRELTVPEDWIATIQAVSRTGHKANKRSPRLLERELIDGSGRVLNVPVGDNLTAKMAMSLYTKIPKSDPIGLDELVIAAEWDKRDLLRVLKIMQEYEMIKVHASDGQIERRSRSDP